MKKAIALLLVLCLTATFFVGCSDDKEDEKDVDKGAVINMYLGSEIRNFDPAVAYTNADAVKILGLLYEGLMQIDDNGKLKKAMADKYTIDEEENKITFELADTCWSDGQTVSADEFVYAFKRILNPSFSSTASILLYPIKNASAVKSGDASIDSLGITAPDTKLLEIELEEGANFDEFLENLASPALVPLRQDKVAKPLTDEETGRVVYDENDMMQYDTTWATKATMHVSNGPFSLKTMDDSQNKMLVLERNKYYRLDKESKNYDKVVKPYRIQVHYEYFASDDALTKLLEDYNNGSLFYLSALPSDQIENYKDELTYSELFSTCTYAFNTENELFKITEVRRALSLALDRNEIAALTSGVHLAANGIVPGPVYNTEFGTSYREVHGDAMSTTADLDAAKEALKGVKYPTDEEGNTIKSFTLTYRTFLGNDTEELVAKYAKEQWEKLGFTVKLEALGRNVYMTKFDSGEYDVITTDYQTNSTSALSSLAPFSLQYSGAARDIVHNNYDAVPGASGYNNEEYNKLIDEALALAPYSEERAAKLFEAEKILMQDAPVIPLYFYRDYYMTQELSGIKSSIYGFRDFRKTKLKNYKDHLPVEETQAPVAQ